MNGRHTQTPKVSRKLHSNFGSTRKILAGSFQTEKKPKKRPRAAKAAIPSSEGENEGHRALKGECDPSPSEFDQNNQNQAEKSSCTKSKKSSGLKRIAKQVIDIIKLRQRMTYPQVAYIVVHMNLKKEDVVRNGGMPPNE